MLPFKSLSKKVQKGYFLQLLFDETSSSFLVLSVYEKFLQDVLVIIKSESYNECVLYWKDV